MKNRTFGIVVVAGLAGLMLTVAWQIARAKEQVIPTSRLPKAVLARIEKDFPKAAIIKAGMEDEDEYRVKVYEVKFTHNGKEREIMVSSDGTVVELETVVPENELPEAVRNALAKAAEGGKIQKIEKTEVLAVVKLVELKTPDLSYEAQILKDGKHLEIKFAPNGKVVETEEEADDDEDDEGEKAVTLDQVPAAVKATILKEAGSNKVLEIVEETQGGRTVYEAEWKSGGKEVEVKVAADGTLLETQVEDEDDDD